MDRWVRQGILAVGAILLVLALLLGGTVTKIFVAAVVLSTWQGLWRGGAEAAGLVAGTLLAVVLAPPIGKGLEGAVAGVLGTGGVLNRMISIAVVGLTIITVVGIGGGIAARKLLSHKPAWRRWNPYAGAALGLVEGAVLGMAVMWAPLALEPIAAGQIEATVDADGRERRANPAAQHLVRFADEVRQSSLGGLAQTTNPIEGSRLLSIMQDFAAISRDPRAVQAFVDSDVMKQIASLSSVQRAKEMIDKDPQLGSLAGPEGISVSSLRLILESETLLKILDETRVVEDVTPLAPRLEAAVRDARKLVRSR